MISFSADKQAGIVDAFNTTSIYVDDILHMNTFFWQYGKSNIPKIAPI